MAKIYVKDGELDEAIKRFKRDVSRAGTLIEAKKRQHYMKPALERKEKAKAARKARRMH